MGIVTTSLKGQGRKSIAEKMSPNTFMADLSSNKGTLTFSSDLVSRLNLSKQKVNLFVGEEDDSPEVMDRVFLTFGQSNGRTVTDGKVINARYFIENLFKAVGVAEEKATFHVSEEGLEYIYVGGTDTPIVLWEVTLQEEPVLETA
ncbi:MAG: hypothetical protein HC836_39090 [Richelia sp. RM2_1_2]|nr:hypothetical protein [Richelia sp. RM2_1_2]